MKFLSWSEWLPSSKPKASSGSKPSKPSIRRQPVSMPMLTLAFARRSFRVSKRIKKVAAAGSVVAGSGCAGSHRFIPKRRALSPGEQPAVHFGYSLPLLTTLTPTKYMHTLLF